MRQRRPRSIMQAIPEMEQPTIGRRWADTWADWMDEIPLVSIFGLATCVADSPLNTWWRDRCNRPRQQRDVGAAQTQRQAPWADIFLIDDQHHPIGSEDSTHYAVRW